MNGARTLVALCVAVGFCASPAFGQAVSPIGYDASSLSDARLGVALATIGELVDAPELLARPSSQGFVDDTFAQIASLPDPLLHQRAAHRRDAYLVPAPATFDRSVAYAATADLVKDVLRALGPQRGPFLSLGVIAEQAEYNARVLRDESADTQVRASIGKDTIADTLVPGLGDLRARLAGPAGHPWDAIADDARRIVAALLGSEMATPFPKSGAVWLVVLRTRTTNADARRHAAHYYLDIVRYDGQHQTIGAYPDGAFAFDRDTKHLICELDKEPPGTIARTVPVSPGFGFSSGQLAEALLRSCDDSKTEGLQYHVASADDDRFIADLLFRNGVSVGPVLRAAVSR